MKTNFKILDQDDPEFVNAILDKKALDEISDQLKKRRSSSIKNINQPVRSKVDNRSKI